MNGTAFDTLATAKALREAGFEDRQAEAPRLREGRLAGVVRRAVGADRDALATKADIDARFADLDTRFAKIDARFAEMRADNAEREARLIRWFVGGMITFNTILFAAIKLV